MEETNLEKQLKNLSYKQPENANFKLNLKKRLLNLLVNQNAMENAQSVPQNQAQVQSAPKKSWTAKFGQALAPALMFTILLFVGIGSVGAYYGIPSVRETIDDLVGVEQTGQLVLTTTPEDVKVYLNGEEYDTTPLDIELPEGNYTLRLSKELYEDRFESFNIEANETTELDFEMESTIPEDPYAGWLTYNNQQYGFGFRYVRDWEISEKLDADNQFEVILQAEEYKITLTNYYTDMEIPGLIGPNPVENELKNGNIFVTQGDLDELKLGYINFESEENDQKLYVEFLAQDALTQSEDGQSIETVLKYMESVWFEGNELDEEDDDDYVPPQTEAKDRFVWQDRDAGTVYSYDLSSSGLEALSTFSLDKEIVNVSPDGAWGNYIDYEKGIYIIDTLGNNKQLVVPTVSSTKELMLQFSLYKAGWSPDSRYFLYEAVVNQVPECDSDSYGCPGYIDPVEEGLGWKSGMYIFDMQTGESQYLADSMASDEVDWSQSSENVYIMRSSIYDSDERKIHRYVVGSDSETYSSITVGDDFGDFWNMDFDFYDENNVLVRYTVHYNSLSLNIAIAGIKGGELFKIKDIKNDVGWTEDQDPRFTKDFRFVIFDDSNEYYGMASQQNKQLGEVRTAPDSYYIGAGEILVYEKEDPYMLSSRNRIMIYDIEAETMVDRGFDNFGLEEIDNLYFPLYRN